MPERFVPGILEMVRGLMTDPRGRTRVISIFRRCRTLVEMRLSDPSGPECSLFRHSVDRNPHDYHAVTPIAIRATWNKLSDELII